MKLRRIIQADDEFPDALKNIPSPPKQLYVLGADLSKLCEFPLVAMVGSRKVTTYGRHVTHSLASDLARKGVVVVSGLALGVDSIAHQAAVDAKGLTIAVLPAGLDNIYPRSHYQLARKILDNGGALISEYPPGTEAYPTNFIARNRLVSGVANCLVITEAAKKSGTLHTANFALEQGKDVMAVPGDVTNPNSEGTNSLIKAGALLITGYEDVLSLLGVEESSNKEIVADSAEEYTLLTLMSSGVNDSDSLLKQSGLEAKEFNQTLTMLEIKGATRASGGKWYKN